MSFSTSEKNKLFAQNRHLLNKIDCLITAINTSTSNLYLKSAIAPIIFQQTYKHLAADNLNESTNVISVVSLNPGDPAYNGGQIVNRGCKDLILTITFLSGGDGFPETPDVLTTIDQIIIIPANTSLDLPSSFWQAAEYVLHSDLVGEEPEQVVFIYSAYSPTTTENIIRAI